MHLGYRFEEGKNVTKDFLAGTSPAKNFCDSKNYPNFQNRIFSKIKQKWDTNKQRVMIIILHTHDAHPMMVIYIQQDLRAIMRFCDFMNESGFNSVCVFSCKDN